MNRVQTLGDFFVTKESLLLVLNYFGVVYFISCAEFDVHFSYYNLNSNCYKKGK